MRGRKTSGIAQFIPSSLTKVEGVIFTRVLGAVGPVTAKSSSCGITGVVAAWGAPVASFFPVPCFDCSVDAAK